MKRTRTTEIRIAWAVAVAATLLAACSSAAESSTTDPSSPSVQSTTSAPANTTAAPASSTDSPTAAPSGETVTWEITGQPTPGEFQVVVVDSSGRNLGLDPSTGPSAQIPETLPTRTLYVHISAPLSSDGTFDPTTPHPLIISGGPRDGSSPLPCPFEGSDAVIVCVGLPMLDIANMNYSDTVNQPGDISRVLDVILTNPDTFGIIDPQHIVYIGGSISGITGLWFLHPLNQDRRITAILASVSFASFWVDAFNDPANWDYGPQILMVNGTEDTTITYELVRRTMEAAAGSTNLTLLTVIGGTHEDPNSGCGAAGQYVQAWVAHQLSDEPAPDEAIISSSGCSTFGLVDGGTTGLGAAAAFVPAS